MPNINQEALNIFKSGYPLRTDIQELTLEILLDKAAKKTVNRKTITRKKIQ